MQESKMHLKEKRRHNSKKCVVWAGKQPVLGLIRAHKEGNGCFVASDWLKRWWIKACHVLPIHYLKKKHLDPSLAGKNLFLQPFCSMWSRLLKRKKNLYFFWLKGKRKKIILSVIEVYNVQSSSTLPLDHYFIRRDVTLSTTSDT